MTAGNTNSKPPPNAGSLSGVEKVAVLLLALGKQRAIQVLKRFDAEELKLITRSVADLQPITAAELEILVEEFARQFSSGVNFLGTAKEVESLLAGVMTEDQIAEARLDEPAGEKEAGEDPVWDKVSTTKYEVLYSYLLQEHPQTAALILSKIDSSVAAKIISAFPPDLRTGLLCRMLGIKGVAQDAVHAVEHALREDLIVPTESESGVSVHTGIADILNRLEKAQSEEVLKGLAVVRPDDAKTLKGLLFTFEDLVRLDPKARTLLFDQIPIERVVLALKDTNQEFQALVLSSLASRSRRMVEAELQGGSTASARDVAEARRLIVQTVLKLAAQGEIMIQAPEVASAQAN